MAEFFPTPPYFLPIKIITPIFEPWKQKLLLMQKIVSDLSQIHDNLIFRHILGNLSILAGFSNRIEVCLA